MTSRGSAHANVIAINDVGVAAIYSGLWTVAVLVAARILLAVGFGYNRLTTKEPPSLPTQRPEAASSADLADLRDRGVISPETYEAERARSAADADRTKGDS